MEMGFPCKEERIGGGGTFTLFLLKFPVDRSLSNRDAEIRLVESTRTANDGRMVCMVKGNSKKEIVGRRDVTCWMSIAVMILDLMAVLFLFLVRERQLWNILKKGYGRFVVHAAPPDSSRDSTGPLRDALFRLSDVR